MAKRYPFVKRYGLEGAESMIVAMDTIFRSASQCTWRETAAAAHEEHSSP